MKFTVCVTSHQRLHTIRQNSKSCFNSTQISLYPGVSDRIYAIAKTIRGFTWRLLELSLLICEHQLTIEPLQEFENYVRSFYSFCVRYITELFQRGRAEFFLKFYDLYGCIFIIQANIKSFYEHVINFDSEENA